MSLNVLHALLVTTARRHFGPNASVGLLSSAPGVWCAWAVTGDGSDSDAQADGATPDAALNGLLARINVLNVAAFGSDAVSA